MSDIVGRLRTENSVQLAFGNDLSDVLLDAALEIELLRSRLLKTFQHDNNCIQTGVPCRVEKCSCYLEMKDWHSDG